MTSNPEQDLARARAELDDAVNAFPIKVAVERLTLFWRHIELNVQHASPLMDIVAKAQGIDLSAMVWRIEPPRGWPKLRLPGIGFMPPAYPKGVWPGHPYASRIIRAYRHAGVVARAGADPEEIVGMRIAGDGIEIAASVGDMHLETAGELARIVVAAPLPETIATAMVGKPIQQLVQHRWLDETRWPVIDIEVGVFPDGSTAITFETGRAPWQMPSPVTFSFFDCYAR